MMVKVVIEKTCKIEIFGPTKLKFKCNEWKHDNIIALNKRDLVLHTCRMGALNKKGRH
jgi:hypothetical protein